MTTPTLTIPPIDLTEADEFALLSITLASAKALDLTNDAISHLQTAAASAHNEYTRHRLRDAVHALERTHLLLTAVLHDLHQAATEDQWARA